jgi:hypothetical protein
MGYRMVYDINRPDIQYIRPDEDLNHLSCKK